jgi:hypothetical protein
VRRHVVRSIRRERGKEMPTQKGAVHERLSRFSEIWGSLLVDAFHYLALFAIARRPLPR